MPLNNRKEILDTLNDAFQRGELALYLGSGVSVDNGIPQWDRLVLGMYFEAISPEPMKGWQPYPNYLFAIAEWHLSRSHEPLEITARRIRKYFKTNKTFLENLRKTLYADISIHTAFSCNRFGATPFD